MFILPGKKVSELEIPSVAEAAAAGESMCLCGGRHTGWAAVDCLALPLDQQGCPALPLLQRCSRGGLWHPSPPQIHLRQHSRGFRAALPPTKLRPRQQCVGRLPSDQLRAMEGQGQACQARRIAPLLRRRLRRRRPRGSCRAGPVLRRSCSSSTPAGPSATGSLTLGPSSFTATGEGGRFGGEERGLL